MTLFLRHVSDGLFQVLFVIGFTKYQLWINWLNHMKEGCYFGLYLLLEYGDQKQNLFNFMLWNVVIFMVGKTRNYVYGIWQYKVLGIK